MKKINKIFTVLILITAMLLIMSLVTFAYDAETSDGVPGTSGNDETSADGDISASEGTSLSDTVIEIVKTAVGEEFMGVASTALNIVLLITLVLLKKSTKATAKDIAQVLTNSDKTMKQKFEALEEMTKNESAVIEAFKCEVYAKIESELAGLFERICEKLNSQVTHEQLVEVVELEKAQLDIIDTIYQNSATIPSATKERVRMITNGTKKHISAIEEAGTE